MNSIPVPPLLVPSRIRDTLPKATTLFRHFRRNSANFSAKCLFCEVSFRRSGFRQSVMQFKYTLNNTSNVADSVLVVFSKIKIS